MTFDKYNTPDLIEEGRMRVREGLTEPSIMGSLVMELCRRLERARELNMDIAHNASLRGRLNPTMDAIAQRNLTVDLIETTDGEYTTHRDMAAFK